MDVGMTAADPDYRPLQTSDIVAHVNNGDQRIKIIVSSAKGDLENPLVADPTTEQPQPPTPGFEVAMVRFLNGATVVETSFDSMDDLDPGGVPNREAFCRCKAAFEYDVPVEAALGPFAFMDEFTFRYTFNG